MPARRAPKARFRPDETAPSDTHRRFPRLAAATTPYKCARRVRARKEHPAVRCSSCSGHAAVALATQCRLRPDLQPLRVVHTVVCSNMHALHDTKLSRSGRW